MPEFVLNRNYSLASKGHMIGFVKGQPTWVPPECIKDAALIGAERVDGEKVDILDAEAKPKPPEMTVSERESELRAAFDLLCERNAPTDFDASNRPTLAALNKILSFETNKRERDAVWPKHRAGKGVQ